jgi:CheY-like chemotaxis protein
MDGYELARRLRAQPDNQKATFIAVTGYGQARDMAESRQAGFDFHFVKPLDPARLLAVLEQISARA